MRGASRAYAGSGALKLRVIGACNRGMASNCVPVRVTQVPCTINDTIAPPTPTPFIICTFSTNFVQFLLFFELRSVLLGWWWWASWGGVQFSSVQFSSVQFRVYYRVPPFWEHLRIYGYTFDVHYIMATRLMATGPSTFDGYWSQYVCCSGIWSGLYWVHFLSSIIIFRVQSSSISILQNSIFSTPPGSGRTGLWEFWDYSSKKEQLELWI